MPTYLYENATVRDRIICSHAVVTAVLDGLRRQVDNMHRSTVAAAIFSLVLVFLCRAVQGKDRELWIQFVHQCDPNSRNCPCELISGRGQCTGLRR